MKLYDPETDSFVAKEEVPSYIWEELIAINEFLIHQA
jgi:hypothetical protein